MTNIIKIAVLKRKVRKYYRQYHSALDNLSCGKSLGEYISSDASAAKKKVNETLDKLAILDPTCTKQRL